MRDGILLGNLLECIIAKSKVNLTKQLHPIDASFDQKDASGTRNHFEAIANLNICLDVCKNVAKLVVVNVSAEDFLEAGSGTLTGKESAASRTKIDLVLGVIWQIIRSHLLESVNFVAHPELVRLLQVRCFCVCS